MRAGARRLCEVCDRATRRRESRDEPAHAWVVGRRQERHLVSAVEERDHLIDGSGNQRMADIRRQIRGRQRDDAPPAQGELAQAVASPGRWVHDDVGDDHDSA